MNFRTRLFLCLVLAVIIGSTFDAFSDHAALRRGLPASLEDELDRTEAFARAAISLDSGVPTLPGLEQELPPDSRFRVLRSGRELLSVGDVGVMPDLERRERTLPGGYTLEVAVDRAAKVRELSPALRTDLTNDLPEIVIAGLVAWLLAGWLLRPLRTITRALDALSLQPSPGAEPVAVPSGRDLIAQLATAFNRMQGSVQAAFERERVFTRYASHELRTPLSAMKLQLESLELGLSSSEKVLPALSRNLERMQRVLEALLSLARASETDHEPVSLTRLVEESIQLLPAEDRSRIALTSSVSPDDKVGNPYLLGQCIMNLIDNAVKYSPGTVEVVLERRAGEVVVKVRDEGGGVPETQLGSLTHTFFRLSKNVEGSGLGLAFVKHIVRTLGGQLALRNTGSGLEVELVLPHVVTERQASPKIGRTDRSHP